MNILLAVIFVSTIDSAALKDLFILFNIYPPMKFLIIKLDDICNLLD
jgi:hypothetical protein